MSQYLKRNTAAFRLMYKQSWRSDNRENDTLKLANNIFTNDMKVYNNDIICHIYEI